MGWVVNVASLLLYLLERDAVPIARDAMWASGRFWTCVENLAPTGFRSPDLSQPYESLY